MAEIDVTIAPQASARQRTPVARRVRHALLAAAVAVAGARVPARAAQQSGGEGNEDLSCPPGPVENYLVPEAQQCWYQAEHGRWRTVSHDLHYYTLVVQIEAESLEDALEIGRRFVDVHEERFDEIVIYVRRVSGPEPPPIRRVRWTETTGFETLDFVAPD